MKQSEIKEGRGYTNGKSIRIIVDSEPECYGPYWSVWYRTTTDMFKKTHECSMEAFARWAVNETQQLPDRILLALRPATGADVLPENLENRVTRILKTEIQKIEANLTR